MAISSKKKLKNLGKIILHIPAREGSKRVPRKNIRDLAGKPMISYAIEESLKSNITEDIYVNTDSEEIISYVEKNYFQLKIYKRIKSLASDNTTSDEFTIDFINSLNPDTLIMINPVCPLIKSEDIKNTVKAYKESDCDTLITCTKTQMQTFCNDRPVNINLNQKLAPSQKNKEIKILNWAISIWDANSFKNRFDKNGFASMGEKRLLYPIDYLKAIKVSEESDFETCQSLLSIDK